MKLLVYDACLKDKNDKEVVVSICLEANTVRRYFDGLQNVYQFDALPNNEFKENIEKAAKEMVEEEHHQNPKSFIINKLERNLIKENEIEKKRYEDDAF